MSKETVGKVSLELMQKSSDNLHSAHDQMQEQLKDYEEHVYNALNRGKKIYDGDFFVVVLTKKERLMPNVLRNYFFSRSTCPTPEWDQTVYHYRRSEENLVFLWTLPAKDVCQQLKDDVLMLDQEDRILLEYVLAMDDGTLLTVCKKLNGEFIEKPTKA